MSEKSLVKDIKMRFIEDHFNDAIEDLLWRYRRIERKSLSEIAELLSVNEISVSVEEVTTWVGYLGLDQVIEERLIKPDPARLPPPPAVVSPNKKIQGDKTYDMTKISGTICDDSCVSAEDCKYYERYFGKICYLDVQAKREFMEPLDNFIKKTYDRDKDLQCVFKKIADQISTVNQLMQRKIRHMNKKGITVIERKIDPSSGKMIENEIPNPLNSAILNDGKQIISMLKEMGMTPKSLATQGSGESDPASLSKAIQVEEERRLNAQQIVSIKQKRYEHRGSIESKEHLLSLLDEKDEVDQMLRDVTTEEELDEIEARIKPEAGAFKREKVEKTEKVLKDNSEKTTVRDSVEIPDEVAKLLENIKRGDKKNG